jgi:hypothetical protein
MADDASSKSTSQDVPASGSGSPDAGSPLDDLEGDPLMDEGDPLGGDNPFAGGDPFGGDSFGSEPAALMMAKFWIRQNALLSVGLAFAAGTLIGTLKR